MIQVKNSNARLQPPVDADDASAQWVAIEQRARREIRRQRLKRVCGHIISSSAAIAFAGCALLYFVPSLASALGWTLGVLVLILPLTALACVIAPVRRGHIIRTIDRNFQLSDDALAASDPTISKDSAWQHAILNRSVTLIEAREWRQHWHSAWPKWTGVGATVYALAFACALVLLPAALRSQQAQPAPTFSAAALAELRETLGEWSTTPVPEDLSEQWAEMEAHLERLQKQLLDPAMDERSLILELNQVAERLQRMQQGLSAERSAQWRGEVARGLDQLRNFGAAASALNRGALHEASTHLREAARMLKNDPSSLAARNAPLSAISDELHQLQQALQNRHPEAAQSMGDLAEAARNNDGSKAAGAANDLADALDRARRNESFGQSLQRMSEQLGQCRDSLLGDGGEGQGQGQGQGQGLPGPGPGWGPMPGTASEGLSGEDGEGGFETSAERLQLKGSRGGQGEAERRILRTSEQTNERTLTGYDVDAGQIEELSREAIADETIPLSHRRTIQRYFESIRPRSQE